MINMADKSPKEMIAMLLLAFAMILGYGGFYAGLMSTYGGNYTNLSSLSNIQNITDKINSGYQAINTSMSSNPSSGSWTSAFDLPSAIVNTAITIGYIFLAVPLWFGSLFTDLSTLIGFVPTTVTAIFVTIIFLDIIAWFIYFWTSKRS